MATSSDIPLFRTAWRRMVRRPLQYILFILGIALGVAMMVSIDLANGSASRAFALSTDAIAGKTTHRIVGGATGLDEAIYRQIRTQIGYNLSAPIVEGLIEAPELGVQPFQLIGVDPFAEPPFRNYLDGGNDGGAGFFQFVAQENGIVVPNDLLTTETELGDIITLNIGGTEQQAQLIGAVVPQDDFTERGIEGLLFADIATAQEMLGMVGKLSRIDLIVDTENDAVLDEIAAILPPDATIETAAAQGNAIRQMTAAFELNLTALSLLALVVGMFLIYNTVTFSVVQRRPLFGILRCLGVTQRQLARLILTEAFIFGLIGSLIGVGLGVLLGRIMVRLVTQTINDLYFTVTVRDVSVPTWTLIKGMVIGVGAALVASAIPAVEAMRTTPNTTLRRSTLESRVTRLIPYLILGFFVLFGLGALFLWIDGGLILAFTGLFAILFASALITAPLTVWTMNALARSRLTVGRPIMRLAPRDIVRSLSRTSVAIAALMVAVSVIVGVSIMIGSFRTTVIQWLDQTLVADIYISPPGATANAVTGALDPAVLAQLETWDGVEKVVTATSADIRVPSLDGAVVDVAAVDGDVSNGNRQWLWRTDSVPEIWGQLDAGEGVFISETFVSRFDLPIPPPPMSFQTPDGEIELPVLGVLYDYGSDQGIAYIGMNLYAETWGDDTISTAGLFVTDGANTDQIVDDMQSTFAPIQTLDVRSNVALKENSIEIFDRTFAITDALRLLATVVAFIGVLSALMSLQLERRRELGTLRATGMTQGQLWQLTLLETGLMGGLAGLIALPTGYVLAWILIHIINVRSFGWTLDMQLSADSFGYALFVAVTAALLAGIYPAYRLSNTIIASALRSD